MKQTKRILSITIQRMGDSDPDTIWLGKYSNRAQGDYSIDRKHSLECPVNNPIQPAIDQLERAIAYLGAQRASTTLPVIPQWDCGLGEAQDILIDAQDRVTECDCEESGDWSHRELQFFNTSGNYKGEPLADIVAYTKQDYERMESLNNGDWGFIGIRAKAKTQAAGDTVQTISSGGLWGIESDSDESYLKSEEQNQLAELRDELYALGFSKRAIAAAVKETRQ